MEFAGHERLDTDRLYQHAVETERRRIIEGMEADARGAENGRYPMEDRIAVSGNAGMDSAVMARLLEKTGVQARIELLRAMDVEGRGEVMLRLSPETRDETLSRMLSASK